MTAERLRQAAAKLRELASEATPGPWELDSSGWLLAPLDSPGGSDLAIFDKMDTPRNGAYVAVMHPGVALAVADLLDNAGVYTDWITDDWVAVADAVLGEP